MILRLIGMLVWQLLGAAFVLALRMQFNFDINATSLALAGAILGGFCWAILNLTRATRVLAWLRNGEVNAVPNVGGVWGEVADRVRRLLRQHVQNIELSDKRLHDFLSAIQASPNGVLLLDANGQIEWCNLTAAEHFGLDIKADVSQHVGNLVRDPLFAAYFSSGDYSHEITIAGNASNSVRPSRIAIQIHPYGMGRKLMLSHDVTSIELSDLMRRDFVANVSHEIRTPLTVLSGFIETLQTLPLNAEEQTRYLDLMAQQALRMQTLVSDLLILSKLEGSPSPSGEIWLNASSLMKICEQEARSLSAVLSLPDDSSERDQMLVFSVSPNLELAGSQTELLSAMSNLINNAVRYTPLEGSIHVTWRICEAGKAEFVVEDSGVGVAPEHLSRLTERFYRVDTSRSRESGGTGLGLVISRRLVDMMEGHIGVVSTAGLGSTFTFSAWFDVSQQQRQAPPASVCARGVRVLVVDDNPDARQILMEQLLALGMRVDEVANGLDGMAALQDADVSDPYALVLMDWHMQGMDGIEATHQITREMTLQHRPSVVMVTAFGADEVRAAGSNAGAVAFLDKPVSQSRLWDTLAETIRPTPGSVGVEAPRGQAFSVLAGLHVLLVEDNEINQQIASELMQAEGVQVSVVDNGQQALDLLQGAPDPLPWSLVLMDLQMPVMDGHQATLALRQQARFNALPIIALTAHASAQESERCLAEGMNEHLSKPIDPEALYRCLAKWGVPVVQAPWRIEGVDVVQGEHHCAGNRQLYISLLQKFLASMGSDLLQMRSALNSGEFAVAERVAHTLKGVAATLGATHCSQLSAELEKSLAQSAPAETIESLLVPLEQHLVELMSHIRQALPAVAPATVIPEAAVDRAQLSRVCNHLLGFLSASNVEAEYLAQTHAALLRQGLGSRFDVMMQLIHDFEYESALAELAEAAISAQINFDRAL